jgi:hypothetical protein
MRNAEIGSTSNKIICKISKGARNANTPRNPADIWRLNFQWALSYLPARSFAPLRMTMQRSEGMAGISPHV